MDAEDKIIECLTNSLAFLNELDNEVQEGLSPTPEILTEKINKYVESLQKLNDSGNAAYFPVPLDLIKYMVEYNDPSGYLKLKEDESHNQKSTLLNRTKHLSNLKEKIETLLNDSDRMDTS